jgi:hypothetical protein
VERDAADEAVLAERTEPAASEAVEPKAYAFDGWGLVPLEF